MSVEPAPQHTLYEILVKFAGDENVFSLVTLRLYDRILGPVGEPQFADPMLAPFFQGIERPRLERHMTAFLVQATGGPAQYSGRAMRTAHQRLGITNDVWDRVIWHVVETLGEFQVPPEYIAQIGAAVAPLQGEIVSA